MSDIHDVLHFPVANRLHCPKHLVMGSLLVA
jgi:hypothetical protein